MTTLACVATAAFLIRFEDRPALSLTSTLYGYGCRKLLVRRTPLKDCRLQKLEGKKAGEPESAQGLGLPSQQFAIDNQLTAGPSSPSLKKALDEVCSKLDKRAWGKDWEKIQVGHLRQLPFPVTQSK